MWVCKFGGTSLADGERIKKIREIILKNEERKVIVVSAPGKRFSADIKVTDQLYYIDSLAKKGVNYKKELNCVRERFLNIRDCLKTHTDVEGVFEDLLSEYALGQSQDFFVSRGEYIISLIISDYLGFSFVDAKEVIIFDYNGRVNLAKSEEATRAVNWQGGVVIPGFYGGYSNGGVRVFSRGGGDVSGSIIANLLNATLYENWTDVDGLRVANPQIVKNSVGVGEITYGQLSVLSCLGANILHGSTVEFVKDKRIPIRIKNTFNPNFSGTEIKAERGSEGGEVVGIVGKRGFFNINTPCDYFSKAKRFIGGGVFLRGKIVCCSAGFDGKLRLTVDADGLAEYKATAECGREEGISVEEVCLVGVVCTDGVVATSVARKVMGFFSCAERLSWITVEGGLVLIAFKGCEYSRAVMDVYNAVI